MSQTVKRSLSRGVFQPDAPFTVPTMPSVPDGVLWSEGPWLDPIAGAPVDIVRTKMLDAFDVALNLSAGGDQFEGSSYGQPFNIVDGKSSVVPVWDLSQPVRWAGWFHPVWPIVRLPLPELVRREGDPGEAFDRHYVGLDPAKRELIEAVLLVQDVWNYGKTFGQTEWTLGYPGGGSVAVWDMTRAWDAPGQPHGVVAAGFPKFPLTLRFDEILSGRVGHALYGALPNYAPGKTGFARSFDGDWKGHPVRAGERLRLRREVLERVPVGTTDRVVCEALAEFGWVCGDRTAWSGLPTEGIAGFTATQDRRWVTGVDGVMPLGSTFPDKQFRLRLSDFEVVETN